MVTLNPGERIYLIKRRHKITLWMDLIALLFTFFIFFLIMLFVLFIPKISWPSFLIQFSPDIVKFNLRFIVLFFLSLLLSFFWVFIFFFIVKYYFTCWIVTNQRTIYVELKNLFNLIFSSVFHDKIQNITISIKGFLETTFRFGNIEIETAGPFKNFVFRQVSEPEIVKQVILEAQRDYLALSKIKTTPVLI